MSANNLSVEREFRYIVQWFAEWSDLQRDDFLPILADYLVNGTNGAIYMNGMISGLAATSCLDKPMSLFQCRVKLFREWSAKWPEDLKLKLKEKLIELDAEFGDKLNKEMSNEGSVGLTNGTSSSSPVLEASSVPIAQNEGITA